MTDAQALFLILFIVASFESALFSIIAARLEKRIQKLEKEFETKEKASVAKKVSAPKEQIDDGFENYDKLKSQIAFFKEETERAKLSLNKKIEEYNQLSFRFCQQSYEKYKLLSNFAENENDFLKHIKTQLNVLTFTYFYYMIKVGGQYYENIKTKTSISNIKCFCKNITKLG